MTRAVLFDLGNTLLDEQTNRPLPGATGLLDALGDVRDSEGLPVLSGLVSDWKVPRNPTEVEPLRQEYLQELAASGLDAFFRPLQTRVTLSTDVGVRKPDAAIFRAALDHLQPGLPFHQAVFVTERLEHVQAARALGLLAIHFRGPGQTTGEVEQFADLLELLKRIVIAAPPCKKHGEAVGQYESQTAKSKQADAAATALVAQVSPARLGDRIRALSDFGTRWTYSSNVGQVPRWVRDRFLEMGYPQSDVRFQPFGVPGAGQQQNVLCGAPADHPGFVLVCAHYDSLSETPSISAPGSDDNASGLAVLLEVAQLLRTPPLRRGLLFAAFGGEEQGLFGSTACADVAAAEQWRIDVVINLDMVAFQDPARPNLVRVEYDQGNHHPGNDPAAKAFGLLMAQAAADYTNLAIEHTDIWNSDYMPFEAKGYAAIGVYEGGENPHYHKTTDTAETVNLNHLAEVSKMVLATMYSIAR
jgi:beta-phosphoglucomutase-like phosphatase (HAD superfamily)